MYFGLSVKDLNSCFFKSQYDLNNEELRQGYLQVVDDTYLILDERVMSEGKLNENGINNLQALQNLIDYQSLPYDYPYNKIDIYQDVKVLILSEGKSILTNYCPNSVIEFPLNKTQPFNFSIIDKLTKEEADMFFSYIFLVQNPNYEFTFEKETSEKIEKDFVSERNKKNEYLPEELDRNINLSKLFSISKGLNTLSYDDYLIVKEMEHYRKKRILENSKKTKVLIK